MNKILSLFMCLLLAGGSSAWAWTCNADYVPFVREGSEWGYRYRYYNPQNQPVSFENDMDKNYIYYIHGDTILNGIVYKKLFLKSKAHVYNDDGNYEDVFYDNCFIALREENKIVYGVALDTLGTLSCGRLYMDNSLHGVYYDLNQEGILYDYNDVYNFAIERCIVHYGGNPTDYMHMIVEEIEDECVRVPGRTIMNINFYGEHRLVEGIGMCPPLRWGDIIFWGFWGTFLCYPQVGGDLMYMRSGEGVYEYLAEGLELSEVETIRNSFKNTTVQLHDHRLTIELPSIDEPTMVEVFSVDGRRVAGKLATAETVNLSLDHVPDGVYVVMVRSAHYSHNSKINLK